MEYIALAAVAAVAGDDDDDDDDEKNVAGVFRSGRLSRCVVIS